MPHPTILTLASLARRSASCADAYAGNPPLVANPAARLRAELDATLNATRGVFLAMASCETWAAGLSDEDLCTLRRDMAQVLHTASNLRFGAHGRQLPSRTARVRICEDTAGIARAIIASVRGVLTARATTLVGV